MSIIDIDVEDNDRFRGELASISKEGKRRWIYAKESSGRYTNRRTVAAWFLLLFLFIAPHIKINGLQFMLFNILERNFVVLGIPFWTQDFYILLIFALSLLTGIVAFTSAFGRVWCGWACPQTIFLEMIYRKLEFFIEGSRQQQVQLDNAPWSSKKIRIKFLKHSLFFFIAFFISNTFLAYIIGSDQLYAIITDPPKNHIVGLLSILLFSAVFYAVFARFREQACIIVCPYGRYMSSLVDENTVAVSYDFKRGEPRKKFSKFDREAESTISPNNVSRGDCIDCGQCVAVCPTGIDIRNGIQLECVNCTACIDACDDVMEKMKKPRGLIRYTSLNAIRNGTLSKLPKRTYAYLAVWIITLTTAVVLYALRPELHVLVLRQSGTTYSKTNENRYVNFFILQKLNKTNKSKTIDLVVSKPEGGLIKPLGNLSESKPNTEEKTRFIIEIPMDKVNPNGFTPIELHILENKKVVKVITSEFLSPINQNQL